MINGSKSTQRGFTVIEVIMFLAISGLMMAGLLFAVSGGINQERYRDATNSFTDFLKEQYNLVDNVQNARISAEGGGPSKCFGKRATTNCTIIGRFIEYDGEVLQSWPIIATKDVVTVINNPDLDTNSQTKVYDDLGLEVLTGAKSMNRDYVLRWQTRLVSPVEDTKTDAALTRTFRLVLLRSPLTSVINTYYAIGVGATPKVASVIDDKVEGKIYLCVDPAGLASQKTGVSINTLSSNSSSVQYATPTECRS